MIPVPELIYSICPGPRGDVILRANAILASQPTERYRAFIQTVYDKSEDISTDDALMHFEEGFLTFIKEGLHELGIYLNDDATLLDAVDIIETVVAATHYDDIDDIDRIVNDEELDNEDIVAQLVYLFKDKDEMHVLAVIDSVSTRYIDMLKRYVESKQVLSTEEKETSFDKRYFLKAQAMYKLNSIQSLLDNGYGFGFNFDVYLSALELAELSGDATEIKTMLTAYFMANDSADDVIEFFKRYIPENTDDGDVIYQYAVGIPKLVGELL